MSGFQQQKMEFLSRQAWHISAHLITSRYTTLKNQSLQKELKGNQGLKRHTDKMLGKEIMLLNKCDHLSAIQTVLRQRFKARSECIHAITWQEEMRDLRLLLPVLAKKK